MGQRLRIILCFLVLIPLVTGCTCSDMFRTLVFSDDFSSDSGYWTYMGSAYWHESSHFVVLTENTPYQAGVIWFKGQIDYPVFIEFDYIVGGGTGADGFVCMFYKETGYAPGYGINLGFQPASKSLSPGYGIEFDNWLNSECSPPDPSSNHVAIIKDTVCNHLKWVDDGRTEDGIWHHVGIYICSPPFSSSDYVAVFLDRERILEWQGTLDRTYKGFGFAAATGAYTNWHVIDNVRLYRLVLPLR